MGILAESHELGHINQIKARRRARDELGTSSREDLDRAQLARLGKRCAVLVTWEGATILYDIGFSNGGPAGLMYGFIIIWLDNIAVFSTLCELISIAPTAGGQYHWVAMLAPKSCSNFSYIAGWITLAGWEGTMASSSFIVGNMIQGLIKFLNPSYSLEAWHAVLLQILVLLSVLVLNTVINSILPKIEGMVLVLHILGFFGVLITLFTYGERKNVEKLFSEFHNEGGWPTQGLSVLVGLSGVAYAFAGVDCSFHVGVLIVGTVAEATLFTVIEVENPSAAVPRSIMTSVFINGAMGLTMMVAMLYGTPDWRRVLNSPTEWAFMDVYYQATGSVAGTTAMIILVIFMSVCCTVGLLAATSRMCWAFSRDRAIPFWRTLSKVSKVGTWTCVPVWAIAATCIFSSLLGLIKLGSAAVFDALVSCSLAGLYSSYLIVAVLMLYQRCGKGFKDLDPRVIDHLVKSPDGESLSLGWGPWHVPGVWGILTNGLACVFLLVVLFFALWPKHVSPEAETMNYAIVVTGTILLFSTAYYLIHAKHSYKGPIREIDDEASASG